MKSPITGKEMILQREDSVLTFRKEDYPVVYHYYLCEDSGERFTSTELDQINMQQVYNQYLDAHNLPFPDEIKEIRKRYGLSATKMSEVLGFGANSYRNYENGEVPSLSNGNYIQLVKDSRKFRDLVEISSAIDETSKEKLLKKLDTEIKKEEEDLLSFEWVDYLLDGNLPDEYTGYRNPNFTKLTEMVVYFSEKLNPWKTQMNKLMFYADFLMFKQRCYSISGARYRAINMGPVPNNYNSIYEYIANNNDIDILVHHFGGEEFTAHEGRMFNPEVFEQDELAVLEAVANTFGSVANKDVPTEKIIEISHTEKAWIENEQERKIISYKYAFELCQI